MGWGGGGGRGGAASKSAFGERSLRAWGKKGIERPGAAVALAGDSCRRLAVAWGGGGAAVVTLLSHEGGGRSCRPTSWFWQILEESRHWQQQLFNLQLLYTPKVEPLGLKETTIFYENSKEVYYNRERRILTQLAETNEVIWKIRPILLFHYRESCSGIVRNLHSYS